MKRILIYIALTLAAVSCNRADNAADVNGEANKTMGTLRFDALNIVEQTEELLAPRAAKPTRTEVDAEGRALPHILVVTISEKESGEVVEKYADHTLMPVTVVLPAGQYIVSARTADTNGQLPFNGRVGFDQPQYGGTTEFTITSGEITSVALSCHQTTAGVTVDYSELFKQLYPCALPGETYRVRVFSSYGGDISFNKGETRTAHFVVPTVDMLFLYQISIDQVGSEGFLKTSTGAETEFDVTAMPVRQACNYNLTIKVLNQ